MRAGGGAGAKICIRTSAAPPKTSRDGVGDSRVGCGAVRAESGEGGKSACSRPIGRRTRAVAGRRSVASEAEDRKPSWAQINRAALRLASVGLRGVSAAGCTATLSWRFSSRPLTPRAGRAISDVIGLSRRAKTERRARYLTFGECKHRVKLRVRLSLSDGSASRSSCLLPPQPRASARATRMQTDANGQIRRK